MKTKSSKELLSDLGLKREEVSGSLELDLPWDPLYHSPSKAVDFCESMAILEEEREDCRPKKESFEKIDLPQGLYRLWYCFKLKKKYVITRYNI